MKSVAMRTTCRLLIISMAFLPFQPVWAGMIGADQVASAARAQTDRGALLALLGRQETARGLQALGLDSNAAKNRVAAMTDDEIGAVAGNIDSLPAGGLNQGTVGTIAVLIIAIVIFYNWSWK